jgi:Tfp pilus assembly protein PilF
MKRSWIIKRRKSLWAMFFVFALLALAPRWSNGQAAGAGVEQVTIRGHVVDAKGSPVAGALVRLSEMDGNHATETAADARGAFGFTKPGPGSYMLTAQKSGKRSQTASLVVSKPGEQAPLVLVIDIMAHESTPSPSKDSMEFADDPNFKVAGVTDWTAAGGHGSDAILRTSESLTRETLDLKPDNAGSANSVPNAGAAGASATRHRLAGDNDEKLRDPLAAVREYQEAVRLDPSEENYFAWGSELLLHRAVWQAKDVFEQGVKAHPKSSRLLTALGSALFAGALYEDASRRLCEASDLSPSEPAPYMFMGKVEIASPNALACIKPRLERFAQQEPGNPLANYYYAMAIWKQSGHPLEEQTEQRIRGLLKNAITFDPKCADAYLELGNLDAARQDYRAAIDQYLRAIDSDPELGEAHYRLAVAYDRAGDHARAKREFELHDQIQKRQAAEVDRQRREVKQFLVVTPDKPTQSNLQ